MKKVNTFTKKKLITLLITVLSIITAGVAVVGAIALTSGKGEPPSGIYAGFKMQDGTYGMGVRKYVAEKNNSTSTYRIYISQKVNFNVELSFEQELIISESDYPGSIDDYMEFFAWREEQARTRPKFLILPESATIPAGSLFVDVDIKQTADAEELPYQRVSSVIISAKTAGVETAASGYLTGGYSDRAEIALYDTDGEAGLIVAEVHSAFNVDARNFYENGGYIEYTIIRTGDNSLLEHDPCFYYNVTNRDADGSFYRVNPGEVSEKIENYNSVFYINKGADGYLREQKLKIYLIDNSERDWDKQFDFNIYNASGFGKTTHYTFGFMVLDDELLSYGSKQYFTSRDTEITEHNEATAQMVFSLANPKTETRGNEERIVRYSIDWQNTTAVYGEDFSIDGYDAALNAGTFTFAPAAVNTVLSVDIINNYKINDAKKVRFIITLDHDVIAVRNKNYADLTIFDDETEPDGNTVSLEYNNESLNEYEFSYERQAAFNLITDYCGKELAFDVEIIDETAIFGVDYTFAGGSYQTIVTAGSNNRVAINFEILNCSFYGTKTFKIRIVPEMLPDGVEAGAANEITVTIIGKYTSESTFSRSSITTALGEDITFNMSRETTHEMTQYLVLEQTDMVEGVHYVQGLFPYLIEWGRYETEKTVTLPFAAYPDITSGTFTGKLFMQNSLGQHYGSVNNVWRNVLIDITVERVYSGGRICIEGSHDMGFDLKQDKMEITLVRYGNRLDAASVDVVLSLDGISEQDRIDLDNDIILSRYTVYFAAGEQRSAFYIALSGRAAEELVNKKFKILLANPSYNATLGSDTGYEYIQTTVTFYGERIDVKFTTTESDDKGISFVGGFGDNISFFSNIYLDLSKDSSFIELGASLINTSFTGKRKIDITLYAKQNYEQAYGISLWYKGAKINAAASTAEQKQYYYDTFNYARGAEGFKNVLPFPVDSGFYNYHYDIEMLLSGTQSDGFEIRYDKSEWYGNLTRHAISFLPLIGGANINPQTLTLPKYIYNDDYTAHPAEIYFDEDFACISAAGNKNITLYRSGDTFVKQKVTVDFSSIAAAGASFSAEGAEDLGNGRMSFYFEKNEGYKNIVVSASSLPADDASYVVSLTAERGNTLNYPVAFSVYGFRMLKP